MSLCLTHFFRSLPSRSYLLFSTSKNPHFHNNLDLDVYGTPESPYVGRILRFSVLPSSHTCPLFVLEKEEEGRFQNGVSIPCLFSRSLNCLWGLRRFYYTISSVGECEVPSFVQCAGTGLICSVLYTRGIPFSSNLLRLFIMLDSGILQC